MDQMQTAIISFGNAFLSILEDDQNLEETLLKMISYSQRMPYTTTRDNEIITEILRNDEDEIKKHLRISATAFRAIAAFIDKKPHGWAPEIELTTFLFWLASGTSYRIVAGCLTIPQSTVNDIVHKWLDFTSTTILPLVVKLPNQTELPNIGLEFGSKARYAPFNRVVGAIDGTHIRISCPVHLHDQYINRKQFYSIQCQAVCDASGKFIDVFAGYPGSVHDTRVLYNSPIFQKRLYPPFPYILLGDGGYPCRLTPIPIITPYKNINTLTSAQKRFNKKHSKSRNVIERTFGQMKTRWRSIFNKALELNLENCVKTVLSCCAFHNICILENDLILEDFVEIHEDTDSETSISSLHRNRDEESAIEFRQNLTDQIETTNFINNF